MATIAEARPTPPNMKLFPGGPTQSASVSGRYQRCGLWVDFRSKNGWLIGDPGAGFGGHGYRQIAGEATPQRGREVEAMPDAPFPGAVSPSALGLPDHAFTKADPGDDAEFYAAPRL